MGKQKQQSISRFFAPKSNPSGISSASASPPQSLTARANPPSPAPKIAATVSFSPSKRLRSSQLASPQPKPSKFPKLSSSPDEPAQNPNPISPQSNPTLHKRFLERFLEPSQELLEPSKRTQLSNSKYTPLEQQVVELKAKYPDVLLMIEVGYKYRFFGADAENAARVLGIYAHMDHNFLTASVPTVRLNVHVRRLVKAGYKVGVVKQTESAAIKSHGSNKLGPFCRGLSALYTKATLEAAEDLGGGEEGCMSCNNYLVCVVEKGIENVDCGIEGGVDVKIGFVGVEVSTGDVVYGEFNDNFMRAGLEAMILNLSPSELLLGRPLSKQTEKLLLAYAGPTSNVRVEDVSIDCFRDSGARAEVLSLYEKMNENNSIDVIEEDASTERQCRNQFTVKGIMDMPDLAILSLALTIHHLKQFGLERIICLGASFHTFTSKMEMTLSANALQQLEVLKNNSDGSEAGSLLQCMNHTLTIFGSRLLRHWVTHPLCDRNMINARLAAVSEIADSIKSYKPSHESEVDENGVCVIVVQPEIHHLLTSVLSALGRLPDIQRGITRIFHRTASSSEFIAVIQAILVAGKQLQRIHIEGDNNSIGRSTVRSSLLQKLISTASSSSVMHTATMLLSTLNKEAADQKDLHNLFIISDGKFPEVAEAQRSVRSANEKLDSLIGLYKKQLKIRNLEYTTVSGVTHLIELPLDVKVPLNWMKVNSIKKAIRYHPPEVITVLDQLSLAKEELTVVCRSAWNEFLKSFDGYYGEFQASVQALASLDCLNALAILSRNKNYTRPVFAYDDEAVQIHITNGRHPVLETVLLDNFVPNDTKLHVESEYCQIVTGPNMGGKSCYIRQVALIAIMAQVGSYVPASLAKLHVLDGIYTRLGASDSIQRGRSTFLEELSETSQILKKCTANSLVIIDELGRGTSTHDGVAIAYATLQHLLKRKKCPVLFVTHYPKIADIKNEFPGSVGIYHVSYLTSKSDSNHDEMNDENITYLYKLVPGISERSFGFKVAQLAQLPASCIRRGIFMAERLEAAVHKREQRLLLQDCQKEDEKMVLEEFGNGLKDFIVIINSTLVEEEDDDNEGRIFQLLMHAKSLAVELLKNI
ncbi:unnamed protein product [Cuscuta campestris]|uniref:DNA mismatch repair protein n=2 Tax=Cuscuta sect. Cleistogrammica TaxID=1824901 RepID=A0A484L8U2_9ASTE|nr:hypothetical protein DM860_010908 [Cuscuta australis]VFQ72716.1 unnamed protein product [Cuscuta campestris]